MCINGKILLYGVNDKILMYSVNGKILMYDINGKILMYGVSCKILMYGVNRVLVVQKQGLEVIKLFSCSTQHAQLRLKLILLKNFKHL